MKIIHQKNKRQVFMHNTRLFHGWIYQYIVTKDNIQIILSAKGQGDVQLQKDLFTKKKKPV